MRRTKIVATLGPATDDLKVLESLVVAGVDVVRLNFSHGTYEEQKWRADNIRKFAEKHGKAIGVLVDLQGPKIRTCKFKEGKVNLVEGDKFVLDAELGDEEGTNERVGLTYKRLPGDVVPGNVLLLDDGRMVLEVTDVIGHEVHTKVMHTGPLSNNKGINLQGGGLSAPALTDKDKQDIMSAAKIEADFVAVSFPRSASDIVECRKLLRDAGGHGAIVAKIERAEALDKIDEIIEASEVIMVARGDLGVEIGDAELPAIQKDLIKRARSMDRVVITATQMMESMIENPIPTRAEVFDVANAVMDGTDAVMLSGETAAGKYPAKVVESMGRICEEAEKQRSTRVSDHRVDLTFGRVDEAVAMATMYTANHLKVDGIAAMTESGSTPLWMSRISSGLPIYALTRHEQTKRRMTLYRGVYPMSINIDEIKQYQLSGHAQKVLLENGVVNKDDLIIITKGDKVGIDGGTNSMKIVRIGA
ncbi:MAG: pyruvate kinase [Gammaproteobacteria bacterium]|nr:pyruvate kinase [Gammaproteobacteria bacterium]